MLLLLCALNYKRNPQSMKVKEGKEEYLNAVTTLPALMRKHTNIEAEYVLLVTSKVEARALSPQTS